MRQLPHRRLCQPSLSNLLPHIMQGRSLGASPSARARPACSNPPSIFSVGTKLVSLTTCFLSDDTCQFRAASRLPACADASRRRFRLEIISFWTFGSAKRISARSLKTGRKQRNLLKTLSNFVLGRISRIANAMGVRKFRLGEKSMRHCQLLGF